MTTKATARILAGLTIATAGGAGFWPGLPPYDTIDWVLIAIACETILIGLWYAANLWPVNHLRAHRFNEEPDESPRPIRRHADRPLRRRARQAHGWHRRPGACPDAGGRRHLSLATRPAVETSTTRTTKETDR